MSTSSRVKSLLFPPMTSKSIFYYAFAIRVSLILFGKVQDANPAASSLEFDTLISITTCLRMLPDMCTTTNRRTKRNAYRYTPLVSVDVDAKCIPGSPSLVRFYSVCVTCTAGNWCIPSCTNENVQENFTSTNDCSVSV